MVKKRSACFVFPCRDYLQELLFYFSTFDLYASSPTVYTTSIRKDIMGVITLLVVVLFLASTIQSLIPMTTNMLFSQRAGLIRTLVGNDGHKNNRQRRCLNDVTGTFGNTNDAFTSKVNISR